jgi:hypothetical protein
VVTDRFAGVASRGAIATRCDVTVGAGAGALNNPSTISARTQVPVAPRRTTSSRVSRPRWATTTNSRADIGPHSSPMILQNHSVAIDLVLLFG